MKLNSHMILFQFIWFASRVQSQCAFTRPNGICEKEFNTPECDYDDRDCCESTCINDVATGRECGVNAPFNCTDPSADCAFPLTYGDGQCDEDNNVESCDWDGGDCCLATCNGCSDSGYHNCRDPSNTTPSPTSKVQAHSGGSYKSIDSDTFCVDHQYHVSQFIPLANWKEDTSRSVQLEFGSVGEMWWNQYCIPPGWSRDQNVTGCDVKQYVDQSIKYALTYCCKLDVWVFAPYEFTSEDFSDRFYCSSKSGSITDCKTWYKWVEYPDEADATFDGVKILEEPCAEAGYIVSAVLLGLFIILLIYLCFKFDIKHPKQILEAFEKHAGRIELVIIGICFGDSFFSSLLITVPLPISLISKGVVVLFFGIINFMLFTVRMVITKAHILESESIGSFTDFTFDFCVGLYFVFVFEDLAASEIGFVFLLCSYAGIVEECLQLITILTKGKWEAGNKWIEWYLDYSGRVLGTVNMFFLFVYGVVYLATASGPQLTVIILTAVALIMFSACCWSWYAYVGCCGKGGHRKFARKEDDTSDDGAKDKEQEKDAEKGVDDGEDGDKDRADNTADVGNEAGDAPQDNA